MEELAVVWCQKITDAGISMVTSHCNQLRVLNLECLEYITGMCALCEDPEPTLCYNWCMIFLQQFITDHKGPPLDHIVSWYNSAHNFITISLILHSIPCCSQICIIIIIIHIFKYLCSNLLCFPQSVQCIFFIGFQPEFSHAAFNSEFFIVIFFYHFQHLPTFFW